MSLPAESFEYKSNTWKNAKKFQTMANNHKFMTLSHQSITDLD